MLFILTENWDEAVNAVATRLIQDLQTGSVLWLVSGGSQIQANCDIMKQIPEALSAKLAVMPIDERYGPVGHANSNWAQLIKAGFDGKQAKLLPVLVENLSFADTAERFNKLAAEAFAGSQIIIGQLGLGEDGHTAGILPNSPASQETNAMVTYYDAAPLQRLTLSFAALRKINAAFVLAFGAAKQTALANLQRSLPLSQQPAQIFKDIPETYIYNDQVGED